MHSERNLKRKYIYVNIVLAKETSVPNSWNVFQDWKQKDFEEENSNLNKMRNYAS
jgi:hypothetical protein